VKIAAGLILISARVHHLVLPFLLHLRPQIGDEKGKKNE